MAKGGSGNAKKNTAPVLNDYNFSWQENSLFTASVSGGDPDTREVLAYYFVDPGTGQTTTTQLAPDGTVFTIDSTTGRIASERSSDFELCATYSLTVKVIDKAGASDTATVTIAVTDQNEFAVAFLPEPDGDGSSNNIEEGAASGALVGVTAAAVDGDGSNNSVLYSLVTDASGAAELLDGPFAIDSSTGVVSIRDGAQLDYESQSSHVLYVKATSSDGSAAVQVYTVDLADRNEFAVSFSVPADIDLSANAVEVGAPAGSTVGITAQAFDPDGSLNVVTYSLVSDGSGRTELIDGAFSIDHLTGQVTVRDASAITYDPVGGNTRSIYTRATSADGSFVVEEFEVDVALREVIGTAQSEVLNGSELSEYFDSKLGNDAVNAGGGDDVIYMGPLKGGADTIDGGEGNDTVSFIDYVGTNESLSLDMRSTLGSSTNTESGDFIKNVENIIGSAFGDSFFGSSADNFIWGMGGNDILNGGVGSDRLYGGDGDDLMTGEANHSTSASDFLYGDAGDDKLIGMAGNDVMSGGLGADLLHGGYGNDTLSGGPQGDTFQFQDIGNGADIIEDFNSAEGDKIDLTDLTVTAGLGSNVVYLSDDTIITATNDHLWSNSDFI